MKATVEGLAPLCGKNGLIISILFVFKVKATSKHCREIYIFKSGLCFIVCNGI